MSARPPVELETTRRLRGVLFDAVGTVMRPDPPAPVVYHNEGRRAGSRRSEPEIVARIKEAWRRRNQEAPESPCPTDAARERAFWRGVVAHVFDDLRGAGEPTRGTPFDELFERLWRHFGQPSAWRLYDDVAPVWRRLRERGVTVGLASNFDDRLAGVCRGLPPLDDCPHLFCSADVGHSKPGRAFYRHIERALGLEADTLLMVGDDWRCDVAGARAAGWRALHLDRARDASVAARPLVPATSVDGRGDGVDSITTLEAVLDVVD